MKTLKNKKGFTLTELVIVIVIIGILAAVLIPSLSGYIDKAKKSAAEQDAQTIVAEYLATVPNNDYADLSVKDYLVQSGNYYVVIDKGAVAYSFKKGSSDYTVSAGSLADVSYEETTGKYIVLKSKDKFVAATEEGKDFKVTLVTVTKNS